MPQTSPNSGPVKSNPPEDAKGDTDSVHLDLVHPTPAGIASSTQPDQPRGPPPFPDTVDENGQPIQVFWCEYCWDRLVRDEPVGDHIATVRDPRWTGMAGRIIHLRPGGMGESPPLPSEGP